MSDTPEIHELRGDLRLDDDLFDAMAAEREAWNRDVGATPAFVRGEGPPKPDRRIPYVCTCGSMFEYESAFERHVERENLKARYPEHFMVGPTGEGPLSAWAFVLAARARGWIVSDPADNGFGSWYVTVWQKAFHDAMLDANGIVDDAKRVELLTGRAGR